MAGAEGRARKGKERSTIAKSARRMASASACMALGNSALTASHHLYRRDSSWHRLRRLLYGRRLLGRRRVVWRYSIGVNKQQHLGGTIYNNAVGATKHTLENGYLRYLSNRW